ncbi:hypothetical protein NDN08_006920 [Rhodosorus marinus]|uniref:CENP-V/GFA domain-containing protein n=1 Tax=Rhodosorus marinus TaxID=101924 RepID=A0AAV8UMV7_9RHOD|nr:hypothetical protein NDN08_006920 [Rhodosorus marinus]
MAEQLKNKDGMVVEGSCHCGKVKIKFLSYTPCPFNVCHCHTDTKTAGAYNVNIMGVTSSLEVTGKEHLQTYRAVLENPDGTTKLSQHERKFCSHCASYLYAWDERWEAAFYPFYSCIDTSLPVIPTTQQNHMMLESKMDFILVPPGVPLENMFEQFPSRSIAKWHRDHGYFVPDDIPS